MQMAVKSVDELEAMIRDLNPNPLLLSGHVQRTSKDGKWGWFQTGSLEMEFVPEPVFSIPVPEKLAALRAGILDLQSRYRLASVT